MTRVAEEEKERKRRVLELKSEFENHMNMLKTMEGKVPKTKKEKLKEFLNNITDWQKAYGNDELATLFYDISYGLLPHEYTDAERWQRHKAVQGIGQIIGRIRSQSKGTLPLTIKSRDEETGKKSWRVINAQKQSEVNKRLAQTDAIIMGIHQQDKHIEQVYAMGPKSRREAVISERKRKKVRRN